MQTAVTFKNTDPSDHLKTYVQEKLNRFDKFLDNPAEANVVLLVEKFRHIAEISISGDRLNINGKEKTNDMYSAIDLVIDKLDKQIKKSKEKSREYRNNSKTKTKTRPTPSPAPGDYDNLIKTDIKVNHIEYKPMDVEEAVMQMDLITNQFLVFTNARTEAVNVLYRRNDGNYGLIQPNV